MAKLSLIIPVYNSAPFLEVCLDSACGQSLQDLEIICIDDGSTDNSLALLEERAAQDGRLVVLSQKNRGPSAARNAGLDRATGDYIAFLDSDDSLVSTACETIVETFEASGAQVVTFGANCLPASAAAPHLVKCLSPQDKLFESFSPDLLFKEHAQPYHWRTAFSRELLKSSGIRFDEELRLGEDALFHFMLYPRARGVQLSSKKLYNYTVTRAGSLMEENRDNDAQRVQGHVLLIAKVLADWDAQGLLCSYGPLMLQWAVQFVALDLYSLSPEQQAPLKAALATTLQKHFSPADFAQSSSLQKRILDDWMGISEDGAPSGIDLYRYYLQVRGLGECVARFWEKLTFKPKL